MRRFVTRTIRDGKVRIFGRTFHVDDRWKRYRGELDGGRFAFGLYWNADEMLDLVCLWGTEAYYRLTEEHLDESKLPKPHCVDGKYVWQWWRAEA